MDYDFKDKRREDELLKAIVQNKPDNSDVVGAIEKLALAFENKLNELEDKIEAIEMTTNVTTEKHEHNIETKDIDIKPIIKAIEDNKVDVNIEKFDDSKQIEGLGDIKKEIGTLSKQIDSFKKAQVQVPVQRAGKKTDPSEYVPVRLTDGKRFYRAIEEMATAMSAQVLPITDGALVTSSVDPLVKYKTTDLDTTSATKYVGYTDVDGNWFIKEITATTIRFVKGTSSYTTNWTNRASLTFDYFYNIF